MSSNVPLEAVRVFLLIENRLLREALVRLFRKRGDVTVVGDSGRTDLTPDDIFAAGCDVLVIAAFQANWHALAGTLESVGRLGLKVVLIGMDADENQFVSSVRAGVSGYLLKDASAADVVSSVRAVFRGEAVCPQQLCHVLFRFVAQSASDSSARSPMSKPDLTLRQQQLVGLVAKGLTNKEIASRLNLSEFTVRNHIHRILKQVDATSREQAVDTVRACGYSLDA